MKHIAPILLLSFLFAYPIQAADQIKTFRETLDALVAADTTNPPGNEARAVEIIARRLKDAGIVYDISEFEPGRQNIVARLKGTGQAKPLLLSGHLDVVGTAGQTWKSDPHYVTERDGYLYGRGVEDMLGMAAIELETFIALKKSGTPLKRDVILALTGDEESGGNGVKYLLKNKPELIADAGIALNETGGLITSEDGKMKFVSMQLAEKTYQDFTVIAHGPTGHSSVPLADNAIYRLARAIDRFAKYKPEPHLLPVTREYFSARAQVETQKTANAMRAIAKSQGKLPVDAVRVLDADPTLAADLRTTCVATTLQGGSRVNALPAQAQFNINCRILPDETIEAVAARIKKVLDDPSLEIKVSGDFGISKPSPLNGELPRALRDLAEKHWPKIPVIPFLSRGATDCRYLRAAGIAAYGFNPIAMTEADSRRAHGIDERIPVASIEPGLKFFQELVLSLVAERDQPE